MVNGGTLDEFGTPEGPKQGFDLWDRLLNQGQHVTGIGGIDRGLDRQVILPWADPKGIGTSHERKQRQENSKASGIHAQGTRGTPRERRMG